MIHESERELEKGKGPKISKRPGLAETLMIIAWPEEAEDTI